MTRWERCQPEGYGNRSREVLRIEAQGRAVMRLHGSLDGIGAADVARVLNGASADVRFDCSGVDLIDGPGLSALVVACRACRDRGVHVVFSGIEPSAVAHLRARQVLDHVLPLEPAAAPATTAAANAPAGVQLAERAARRSRRGSSWRWRHS